MGNAVRVAGIAFALVAVLGGCSGASSSSSDTSAAPSDAPNAATASPKPVIMTVSGFKVAFNDASTLETYEKTRDLQGDDAAGAFANTQITDRGAILLEGKQEVSLISRRDSTNGNRYGENCNVRVLNALNVWVQCSQLTGPPATDMPYGKSGTFDAEDADAKGNALAYLFPTLAEACAYENARGANQSIHIPADAIVLRGIDHLKARMVHSRPGYDCSDSFAIDANYVEVLEGPGKGSKGWTGAIATIRRLRETDVGSSETDSTDSRPRARKRCSRWGCHGVHDWSASWSFQQRTVRTLGRDRCNSGNWNRCRCRCAKAAKPRWPPKMYHPWPVENVPGVGGHFSA